MSRRRSGFAALGCAGVLGLSVAALAFPGLRRTLPETPPIQSLGSFETAGAGDRLRLTFGFADYDGRPQRVSCTIRREDYLREVAAFGYVEREIWDQLDRQVRDLVLREVAARGLASYFEIDVYGQTSYRWQWSLPGNLPRREEARLLLEMAKLDTWLNGELRGRIDGLTDAALRERGFRLRGNRIAVDYEQVALRGTGPLADCFEALRRAGRGLDEEHLLRLFVAFFQELPYQVPPEEEGGRRIHGFWVPTAVLARGGGDCDSKSIAFCSLWRNFPRRVLLILVPDHALVGVEERPGPGEAYVRLGNRYFVLCEVAGP
ncbi:MAG TPA: hypothetical protein VJ725_19300, partial [Thermoanaerobaculia bacterium]|nr:hypothetical protein [Thermoanaerobaculia bacterium]